MENTRTTLPVFEETIRIRSYEVDHSGRMSIIALQQYLQEAAVQHAIQLKISMYELAPQNLTWVLSRIHLKVLKYPRLHQYIRIRTWPSERSKLYALREFEILDEQERQIVLGTSSWMMINLETKRPVSVEERTHGYPQWNKRALADDFPTLPELQQTDFQKKFFVRLSDLDINQHVNNISYVDWCLESIPLEFWNQYRLEEIEINYRAESFYGDVILSHSQLADRNTIAVFYHQLFRESDQKELARARTTWKEISKK